MSLFSKSAVIVISILSTLLASQQALAHAHLRSAEPAEHSDITVSPDHLTLHFSEDLEAAFSGARLTEQSGKSVPTGKSSVAKTARDTLIVPVSSPLSQGKYRVYWHALSVDGHKTTGSYTFTVR